jgi:putative PEP-CTERM system TPR-repeat lipoprotein
MAGALALLGSAGNLAAATAESTQFVEQAQAYLAKGDWRAAIIELKNAVRSDPDNAAARYTLGLTYLQVGDAASAEKELKAARERGLDEPRLLQALAQAHVSQGEYRDVLDTIPVEVADPQVTAELLSWHGYAYLGLQQGQEAEKAFTRATQVDPKSARAHTGLAYVLAQRQDGAGAEEKIDKALSLAPKMAEALAMKGELRRLAKDAVAARSFFDQAIEADANSALARSGRAALLIDQGELDLAQQDVSAILAVAPRQLLANYLQALIDAGRNDLAAATNRLVKESPSLGGFPPALNLLGTLYYLQGQTEQAQTFLTRYLGTVEYDVQAMKLLGNLFLRKGQAAEAIAVLGPALAHAPDDVQLLGLLSVAYMRNGQLTEAGEALDKATAVAPDDVRARTTAALGRLQLGEPETAIKDLQAAVELDPGSADARLLLALAYLRNEQFDEALAQADELKRKVPDNPMAENLLAAIQLTKGDAVAGRAHLEQALKLAPDFRVALLNLARLDVAEGKLDAARQRYESIVAGDPKATDVMIALAEIEARQGRPEQAQAWLLKAEQSDPAAAAPKLALVEFFIAQKQFQKALDTAQVLHTSSPQSLEANEVLARAQLLTGDAAAAVTTLRAMATLAPESAPIQHRLGQVLLMNGDQPGALAALAKAVELDPEFFPAQLDLLDLKARSGQVEEALKAAIAWRERHPTADGETLVGMVLARADRLEEAIAAYRSAFAKQESSDTARRLYGAIIAAGDAETGIEGLRSWVGKHPDDHGARFSLGNALLQARQYEEAAGHYELLLSAEPGNAILLNNLAWLYAERGDGRALEFAERASKLAPDSVEVADTLGFVLIKTGDAKRAVDVLTQAHSRADHMPDITYHLAMALNAAGKHEEARTLLEKLLASHVAFESRADAEALHNNLTP